MHQQKIFSLRLSRKPVSSPLRNDSWNSLWTTGSRVNVCTIHAFCNDVIQAYLVISRIQSRSKHRWYRTDRDVWTNTDWAKIQFLSSEYDPLFYLQTARDRVGKLKQEWVSVSQFRAKIEIEKTRYTENSPRLIRNSRNISRQKKKTNDISGNSKTSQLFMNNIYLSVANRVSTIFSDMIRFVLEEFRRDENLCYMLAERYRVRDDRRIRRYE